MKIVMPLPRQSVRPQGLGVNAPAKKKLKKRSAKAALGHVEEDLHDLLAGLGGSAAKAAMSEHSGTKRKAKSSKSAYTLAEEDDAEPPEEEPEDEHGESSDVWDPAVQLSKKEDAALLRSSEVGGGGGLHRPSLNKELVRHRQMRVLASRFQAAFAKRLGKKWRTHFEDWLYARKQDCDEGDPVIPEGVENREDPELLRKLLAAGQSAVMAGEDCLQLGKASTRAAQVVARAAWEGPGLRVEVDHRRVGADQRPKLVLTCGGVGLEVNPEHYAKLRRLYRRNAGRLGREDSDAALAEAAFVLLARYNSQQGAHYQGGGFQAAIHGECFDVLRDRFGVALECFASPLNCRWGRYCSAHADTDAAFGSLGSFWELRPDHGSFEANPPFDAEVIAQMAGHMERLLARASTGALSFVVIVPCWRGEPCWEALGKSQFLRHHLVLEAEEHGYCEGAQHVRTTRYRTASAPTSVFFLQTAAAALRWPATPAALAALQEAFAPRVEAEAGIDGKVPKMRAGGAQRDSDGEDDEGARQTAGTAKPPRGKGGQHAGPAQKHAKQKASVGIQLPTEKRKADDPGGRVKTKKKGKF